MANPDGSENRLERLVLVYNADWSLRGGLEYAAQMLRGQSECALCEITHGKRLTEKKAWKSCRDRLSLPVDLYFRNKVPAEIAAKAGNEYPVVLARTSSGLVKLLGRAELEQCGGDPDALVERLQAKAQDNGISIE